MKKSDDSEKNDFNLFSPTLITSYAEKAIDLIYSTERFLYLLLPVLITFGIVILLDIAAIKGYVYFLPDGCRLGLFSINICNHNNRNNCLSFKNCYKNEKKIG